MSGEREYLLEYKVVGTYVKVSAIDPVSGKEVCILGPADGGRELLGRIAARKLDYVLSKNTAPKPADRRPGIRV